MKKNYAQKQSFNTYVLFVILLITSGILKAQVTLENEIKITDFGLHFDGTQKQSGTTNTSESSPYDYHFGRNISAHGDCIKTYTDSNGTKYVFMTWYRGGKGDRHVMLTRYNINTGLMATIEFPHRHTGYQNQWWIGESHNTIGIGISPLDGTVHLLYDMHAYSSSRPSDGSLSNDYFRYSYSMANVASLPDVDFTLDKFVPNTNGGYKHLRLTGNVAQSEFVGLTYPKFFQNNLGDLFMIMREGGNNNGAYKFTKYNASTSTWSNFTNFNALNARNQSGITYNWGLYGSMKYVNGKFRMGFQRRSSNNGDKFQYQNGVYYAYSNDQDGISEWKNHQGQSFDLPLYDADVIKIMEPGDYVQGTNVNSISIVSDFDWTVTEKGDVHIISRVRDNQFGVTKYLHTYKPAGSSAFITSENFAGGSAIYTAGDDIYIIGLTSGRVYVEKAEGGTNNFTRVYQANSGKVFDHGSIHIDDGKLYYYLMNRTSGNAQPLYLQIIDLDIVVPPFRVSLTSPFADATYNVGETIPISADAIDENGSISKVEFRVNGAFFAEDATAPYALDWTPNTGGAYTVQAVAYNAINETVLSSEITVNFQANDPNDLTGDTYKLKNYVTGKYMHSVGSDVVESDNGINVVSGDKEWEFVKAGVYYNLESKKSDRGILRASGNPVGDIVNTTFPAPREDSDKQFVVIYNSGDGTYQFQTRTGSNYIYHNVNGIIEHVGNTDDRSKWIVESTTLSVNNDELISSSIKIYPNPAKNKFTIALRGLNKADITISDMLGKTIYMNSTTSDKIQINNDGRFKPGIYLIKVVADNQRIYNSKLVVK